MYVNSQFQSDKIKGFSFKNFFVGSLGEMFKRDVEGIELWILDGIS
jgi:hypothetical protein